MDYKDLVVPNHVGIIMDGNGRWATERGKSRSEGHRAGADNIPGLLEYIISKGVKNVSLYAFSTENFKRASDEVGFLMKLFIVFFKKELNNVLKHEVKVVFSGRRENIPNDLWDAMCELEERTKDFTNGILNVCLNYGGDYEIVDMTKKIAALVKNDKLDVEDISKELVMKNLYNELPPIDLVIRTSGELRISNFMIYQAAYAEYYFPSTYFPDFNAEEFDKAIVVYNQRKRRFGGN